MKELVEYLASALVDNPEPVSVVQEGDENAPVFQLKVGDDDLGKVIGKKGRTAKALRTLLAAVGSKQNLRVTLEIVEPPRRRRNEPAPQKVEAAPVDVSKTSEQSAAPPAASSSESPSEERQTPAVQSEKESLKEKRAGNVQGAEALIAKEEESHVATEPKPVSKRAPRRAPVDPVKDPAVLDVASPAAAKAPVRSRRKTSIEDEVSLPRRRRAPVEKKSPAIERVISAPSARTLGGDAEKSPARRRAPLIERKSPLIERVAPPSKLSDDEK